MFSKSRVQMLFCLAFLFAFGSSKGFAQQLQPPSQDWVLRFHESTTAAAPLSPVLNLGNTFTIEAWIFPEGLNGCAFLMGKQDANGWYGIRIWNAMLGIQRWSPESFGAAIYYAPQDFELRKWMHVAATLGVDGQMRLYLNGVQVAEGPSNGPCEPIDGPLMIGPGIGIDGYKGSVCQVRAWNYALTSQEILNNAGRYLSGNESGLIAYWPFDDGPGYSMRDLGPFNLTINIPKTDPVGYEWTAPLWVRTGVITTGPYLLAKRSIVIGVVDCPGCVGIGTLIDFDSDGDLDVVSQYGPPLIAFRNDGTNNFELATDQVIRQYHDATGGPGAYIVADLNGDGRQDLLTYYALFIQSPNGQLVDETDGRLPPGLICWLDPAISDINGDGSLDIFMGNTLLINDGNGYFSSQPNRLPEDLRNIGSPYSSSVLVDVNADCAPDLVLGSSTGYATHAVLLLNDGHGNFSYAPDGSMPPSAGEINWQTFQVLASDFDGDGYQDLLLVARLYYTDEHLKLYLNNGNGSFRDASAQIPVFYPTSIDHALVGDFNGDGRPDIYTGGEAVGRLYLNTGDLNRLFSYGTDLFSLPDYDPTGHPRSYETGFGRSVYSNCGDFEGDGDLDLLIFSHMGPVSIVNYKPWPMPNPLSYPLDADLISPQNASDNLTLPILKWTGVVTAGSYQLQVATDQYFNNIAFDRNGLTCSSHQPATLIKGKTYYWRVRAYNTRGPGPWSEVWSFYYGDFIPYTFEGFFSPIENSPVVNQAKAGQAIPVKWRITDKNGLPISDPASFKSITSYSVNCAAFAGDPTSTVVEELAAGSSGLQYKGDGWWQFNWKTPKSYKAQCRVMKLTLDDKSEHTASFSFK